MSHSEEIVIVNGARTAFGAFGGSLAEKTATDLQVIACQGAMAKAGIKADTVDQVVLGNVLHTSKEAIYMGRHVALRSGMSMKTPAVVLNLLCGSGVKAVCDAESAIRSGQAKIVVAGGVDQLTMTPYLSWDTRWGKRMGHGQMYDGLDIRDTLPNNSMGETAENLQSKYQISREDQDEFALRSQTLAKKAQDAGRFAKEIVPVEIADRKGNIKLVASDEHLRPETTLAALAALRPAFKKDGTVTAGNACGIVDGACALVVTTAKEAEKQGLKPLCRIVSSAVVGVPPEIMGIGPVEAIPEALAKANLTLNDIDLIEINEAFAVQYIACERELKLDREKVNVNGGAIALGHPFGASGARLLLTLGIELQERKARYGLASLCVGGGMGIAMIVERL
jgi:acetyl-CoA C-acetyltransferase